MEHLIRTGTQSSLMALLLAYPRDVPGSWAKKIPREAVFFLRKPSLTIDSARDIVVP